MRLIVVMDRPSGPVVIMTGLTGHVRPRMVVAIAVFVCCWQFSLVFNMARAKKTEISLLNACAAGLIFSDVGPMCTCRRLRYGQGHYHNVGK